MLKYGFFRQFFGYKRFSLCEKGDDVKGAKKSVMGIDRSLGLILKELETDIFDISKNDCGEILFCCMLCGVKKLDEVCRKYGIALEEKGAGGLSFFAKRHKKRIGIFIGVVLCLGLHLLSEKLVWEIRVSGNQRATEKEIVELLSVCGFSEGTYYPAVDLEALYRDVLLADNRISWISVNIKGTVALVEVRESIALAPKTDYEKPANLVAARDGKIVRIDIVYGGKEVKNGDYVSKGQLLASPFFPSRVSGPVFQSPIGSVYAETNRNFEVNLPKKTFQKRYTGEKSSDYNFKILGKSLNVNRIVPTKYDKYDISHEVGNVMVFGKITLPLKYVKRDIRAYRIEQITRTADELYTMGKDMIYSMISDELADAEILEIEFNAVETEEEITVKCSARVVENIAVSVPMGFEA